MVVATLLVDSRKWVARLRLQRARTDAFLRRAFGGYAGGGQGFTGGGASGTWREERPPPEGQVITWKAWEGDISCPPSGVREFYRPFQFPTGELADPHPNAAPRDVPCGHRLLRSLDEWTYADWALMNNATVLTGDQNADRVLTYKSSPDPPAWDQFKPGDLPYPIPDDLFTHGTAYVVQAYDPASRYSVSSTFWGWDLAFRSAWTGDSEICTPPVEVQRTVFVDPGPDRRKVRDTPDVEERPDEDDDLVPPPFVAAFPVGFVGRPDIGRGGFRPRRPPRKRTRERKKASTIQSIFRILDVVSETAEVVDCVFEALPKETKDRWKKGRPNRGLLDQAGQYGIDGADWKGQAIWHNHKLIDWGSALKCVAANQIEDKIIGFVQSKLPRNVGNLGFADLDRSNYYKRQEAEKARWARIRRENKARAAQARGRG